MVAVATDDVVIVVVVIPPPAAGHSVVATERHFELLIFRLEFCHLFSYRVCIDGVV